MALPEVVSSEEWLKARGDEMHETYYTPEQLAQLEARREEVGEDEIAAERGAPPLV